MRRDRSGLGALHLWVARAAARTAGLGLLLGSGLAGCGDADPGVAPPQGTAQVAACTPYQTDPEALAYCHYLAVAEAQDLDTAERLCGAAGDWEARCRTVWVGRMGPRVERAALLAFCADQPCRFGAIDHHLSPDLDLHVELCTREVPDYRSACLDHALIAWSQSLPAQAHLEATAGRSDLDALRLGRALGEVVLCASQRSCAGNEAVHSACAQVVAQGDRSVCGGAPPAPQGPASAPPAGAPR